MSTLTVEFRPFPFTLPVSFAPRERIWLLGVLFLRGRYIDEKDLTSEYGYLVLGEKMVVGFVSD